jgi:hypothetical protein
MFSSLFLSATQSISGVELLMSNVGLEHRLSKINKAKGQILRTN